MISIVTTGNEPPEYVAAVAEFLEALEQHDVRALMLVALCNDEDTNDVVGAWDAGPNEMSQAAGILSMHAAFRYMQVNTEEEEEGEDDG